MPPTWLIAALLVGTGVAGGLGHWFLIVAHRDAPPTVLAPFNYTQLIWMIVLGYLVFGDIPGPSTLIGAASSSLAASTCSIASASTATADLAIAHQAGSSLPASPSGEIHWPRST